MSDEAATHRAECRISVPVDPATAFEAWTDPERLAAWMAHRESGPPEQPRLVRIGRAAIAPRAGAPFVLEMVTRSRDGEEKTWPHSGEVREAVPGSRISVTWTSEGTDWSPTILSVDLVAAPDGREGTEVRLRHEGFLTADMAREHAEGWEILLELFNEAMLSVVTAGVKAGYAELKRREAAPRGPEGPAAPFGDAPKPEAPAAG